MTCKGICERPEYHAPKPTGMGRYASGQKRCQICETFIKVEGLCCPCCGYRLRSNPRAVRYKRKLRVSKGKTSLEDNKPNRKQMEYVDGKLVLTEISQDV